MNVSELVDRNLINWRLEIRRGRTVLQGTITRVDFGVIEEFGRVIFFYTAELPTMVLPVVDVQTRGRAFGELLHIPSPQMGDYTLRPAGQAKEEDTSDTPTPVIIKVSA